MFTLNDAIQNWMRKLRRNPAFEDGDIAELESHLREVIERFRDEGYADEEAFRKAVDEIGEAGQIGQELYKTRTVKPDATPPWKHSSWVPAMLPNYLKVAFRTIRNTPVYSFINITGLAIGIACCVLIVIYLQFQLSFDRFHRNGENLYRLNKVVTPKTGGTERHAITSGPMGPQLKRDFPEVREYVRVMPWFDDGLISRNQQYLKVDQFVLVDSTFLDIFDFNLLSGNPETALRDPKSIVLSHSVATRLFGEADPVGENVEALNGLTYTVTGVIEDPPVNSHLTYDALISWSSTGPSALGFDWLDSWLPQAHFTYLLLNEDADPGQLESKFTDFMERHFAERADQYSLYLQPFNEIYLHSARVRWTESIRTGSITNIYVFAAAAILILLIACINFMNLSTARSFDRAREIGVRKVLGAYRSQLGGQFLGESVLMSLIAMAGSYLVIRAGLPLLGEVGVPESVLSLTANPSAIAILAGIGLLTGLLSGAYPALVLSGFQPVSVLYGRREQTLGGDSHIRKGMVVLQFALSIILIVGTLVIYRQMQFVSDKNLGFQKEQILVLPIDETAITEQPGAFKNELLDHANIHQVTGSNSIPGTSFMSFGINPEGKEQDESWTTNVLLLGDDNFLETYGMEMEQGRFFSSEYATDDSGAVVINRALAESLGWDNPVGKRIDIPGELENAEVIGVVKDFHTASLHQPVEPLLMMRADRWNMLSLRIEPSGIQETLGYIEATWQRFDPAYPFEYYFLDDRFEAFYSTEKKMLELLGIFTLLAILVASLGLFGLSTYIANKRTKEIGIRKVFGSSIAEIIRLLSLDFLKLIGMGFVIAVPIGYLLSRQWLQSFVYHVEPAWWIYILSGGIALVFALAAVSFQSIRAATMDPVESLRSE